MQVVKRILLCSVLSWSHVEHCVQVWTPQYKKDIHIFNIHKIRRGLMAACSSSHVVERQSWALLFGDSDRTWVKGMELCRGGPGGGWGKVLHQKAVGMAQAALGSGHCPELQEFKEHLDNVLIKFEFRVVPCRAGSAPCSLWVPFNSCHPIIVQLHLSWKSKIVNQQLISFHT